MTARSLVLGTAGHIDHGKTSLVYALTGTDTDRLPEEKARGITIDLGFASLPLSCGALTVDWSIVDVPGHHAFIRNMLAGTGGIDCVLLVLAADEGPKPQTSEHLAICSLLGISHGLVVLTKCDLVGPEQLRLAHEQARALTEGSFLAKAPVMAVSARTGAGLPELKQALCQLAAQVPAPAEEHVLRLPIDRIFAVRGFGTVVTGTLHSGRVHAGDQLVLQPGERTVRVRGVQKHGAPAALAEAPTRVALNLAGVEVAELHRGDTLVAGNTLTPTSVVDVELILVEGESMPRHRSQLRVHAWASETTATVLLYGEGSRLARLRLREPLLLVPGDRLVLRQPARSATVAGARVLDASPLPRVRKARALRWLSEMVQARPPQQVFARVERRSLEGCTLALLQGETGLTLDALRTLLAPWMESKQLVLAGELVLTTSALTQATAHLFAALERAGDQALSRAQAFSQAGLTEPVFAGAWARLSTDARVQASHAELRLRQNKPTVQNPLLARLEALYRNAGLASPLVSEAAARLGIEPRAAPALITQLLRSGLLVRMGSDNLLVHAQALAQLREQLHARRGQSFDVASFKQWTGLTRKHAIPLLEYLDGVRATRNTNGVRTVL